MTTLMKTLTTVALLEAAKAGPKVVVVIFHRHFHHRFHRRKTTNTHTVGVECQSKELEAAVIGEQKRVGELVGWCVEQGFSGTGLGVRPATTSGRRGRGLEATRVVDKNERVLTIPLRAGIVDEGFEHPAKARKAIERAPWGVRLACRLLQERRKGERSNYAPYLELIPEKCRNIFRCITRKKRYRASVTLRWKRKSKRCETR